MGWTARRIPDQSGRTAVVTGANSGLGYVTARELARRGGRVVLACRNRQRGERALERLLAQVPEADVELRQLDLADLGSVRGFASALPDEPLHLLVNNAGLMAVPHSRTADGFEMQFGVNHLGHFALTGLLMDRLLAAEDSRVVNVSSLMHTLANIDMADLNSERHYRRWTAYGRSKTANLLFTLELARRTRDRDVIVAAAHPGYSATELQGKGPRLAGDRTGERLMRLANSLVGSSAELGAAATLYAATSPDVGSGSFVGPRVLGLRGAPGPSWQAPWTRNAAAARQLWAASEDLTGIRYGTPA
jgi:NAD(P)-dependent dehydrogenase (short-subunit alcohol dehydrogenase family)